MFPVVGAAEQTNRQADTVRHRQADTPTERHRRRQTGRQTDTDRQTETDRQTGKQPAKHTDRRAAVLEGTACAPERTQ